MRKYIIYIIFALAGFHSCLDIKLENQFSDPYAITSTTTARELLATAYNSLPRYQLELSLLSDDFAPTSYASSAANLQNIYNWNEKDLVELSSYIWTDYYVSISYLNALLPRLDNVKTEDETDKAELEKVKAETYALKAYCYFDLLRIFGPRYAEENLTKDGIIIKNRLELDFLPRSSVKDCISEIESLLDKAEKIPNQGAPVYYFGEKAVAALRAEFELYRKSYGKAAEYAGTLLTDIEQHLNQDEFNKLWSANESQERIFAPYIFDSFYIELNYDNAKGDYFKLAEELVYDDADLRKQWCEFQGPQEGVRCFGKYNKMYFDKTEVRYINTIRYSGALFTAAEAYARKGTAPDTEEARKLLNKYLTARGLTEVKASLEGEELISRILEEKHKEFVGEGVRYFDLKRIGAGINRYNDKDKITKTIQPTDYKWLLSIPQSEYKYNDNITEANQNPGWPYEKTN